MSEFGFYFGTKVINITETKGKKVLVNISIPKTGNISSGLKQEDADQTKQADALREEFRKNEISPCNVSVALAGEDLIIRTFDLPIFLSKKELKFGTVAFEAKKYIPFKIEDLVFDFQLRPDREAKKILVLFVGIKKGILDKYLSLFEQLQIQARLIEYAGFSILRLLRLGGLKDRGILGVLNVDLEEETNFLVCQNGFPLFSRDITLIPSSETEAKSTYYIEKLKSEIRISLDFFRRKFLSKPLNKLIILSPPQLQTEIATLTKDLGLSTTALETSKFLGRDLEFSGALAKSYTTAISNRQRLRFQINLLRPEIKEEAVEELSLATLPTAITSIRIKPKTVLLAFLIIFLAVGWGWYRQPPLKEDLNVIRAKQPKIEGISDQQTLPALMNLESEYANKVNIMEDVVKNRFYLIAAMDIIPQLMPEGAWLTSFSFRTKEGELEFSLEGMVSLGDPDKEFTAVNDLVLGLKNDPKFSQRLKEINPVSIESGALGKQKLEVTKFEILCR